MGSRIKIFAGHFGSGKTEIALNYALKLKKDKESVTIADLDIVNPYFCTRDQMEMLEKMGIRVVATPKEYAHAELGTIPLNTISIFDDASSDVVVDVGGDEQGAVALGQYYSYFAKEAYDMYFVINTLRPSTSNADEIIEYITQIEKSSRLKVNYLINNTNLSYETTAQHIIDGQKIVEDVMQKTGLKIAYTCVREDLVSEISGSLRNEIFPIKVYMQPEWFNI